MQEGMKQEPWSEQVEVVASPRVLSGRTRTLRTQTPAMFAMVEALNRVAVHEVTVLLIGEIGTGKTYLGRLIHELSPRREGRCLTLGCGTQSPEQLERELFGYVEGAREGTSTAWPGKLAAAAAGSLLLDEIDTLAPKQQAQLLRVIEAGEYEPVGSEDPLASTARLIVSSCRDLHPLVEAGEFRKDLFHRLNLLSFRLPPLRQRPDDLEHLAHKFALDLSLKHQLGPVTLTREFLDALARYSWPGNIRELEGVMRRAVLCCRDGIPTPEDLPREIKMTRSQKADSNGNGQARTLEQRIEATERRAIEESLERHHFHRADTAKELGISRVTLYNKMKKFGMLAS